MAVPSEELAAPAQTGVIASATPKQAPSPWQAARHRFVTSRTGVAGAIVLLIVVFCALFAAQVAPYNPTKQDFRLKLLPPSREHLMGTDDLGRAVFSRVVRGSVLAIRGREYVDAARTLGASDQRIMWQHVLPNTLAPLIVLTTLNVGQAIIDTAGLSFLGLGTQPPTPDWGNMLAGGRNYIIDAPWIVTFPGLAILATVLAFNLMGDALRDAFDPRLR